MTMSEFETLRGDLAGLGGEMSALRADVTALKADVTDLKTDVTELKADVDNRFGTLRTELEIRFARIEAKIDEKPSTGTIYQAALAIFAGTFTVFAGTLVALKSLGFIS
jgi:hypothetical protein